MKKAEALNSFGKNAVPTTEFMNKGEIMRMSRLDALKNKLAKTKREFARYEENMKNAPNLHERDVAFVMMNAMGNRIHSLYERIELELI